MAAEKTPVKAKELSKWGIALGVLLVVALSIARGFWPVIVRALSLESGSSFGMTQGDILLLGLFCISAWSPVFLSMWFDKFLGPRSEGACGSASVQ